MKVTKLLHTRMRVSDMDQTIRFYQNVLGLEVMDRKVSPRGSHLAFLKAPNSDELIELCSFPASGPVTVQEDLVHLAFEVENLDETIRSLESNGIRITDGPTRTSSSRFIFIDAPDGYEVELIERWSGTSVVKAPAAIAPDRSRIPSPHPLASANPLTNLNPSTYCSLASRVTIVD